MIGPEKGRRYWNPYLAGAALGIVVTVSFAFGRYFGASRAFATFARWLRDRSVNLDFWMSWEVLGLLAGGMAGALLSGRFRPSFTAGPRFGGAKRVVAAAAGGVLVMIGSRFASGCTSGLALSGGIRMSVGAFVFMGAMFVGGFAAAAVARRIWS